MAITYAGENVVQLRFGANPTLSINGQLLPGVLRFALRQEVDRQWVDVRALWGDVRVVHADGETAVPVQPVPSVPRRWGDSGRVVHATSMVEFAPGCAVPAQVRAISYKQDFVTISFAIPVGEAVRLEVEGLGEG